MTAQLQLYMWSPGRDAIIEKHRFYVEQIRERIIAQFRDIEGEAEAFADATYQQLGSMPGDENSDMSAIAKQRTTKASSDTGYFTT